MRSGQPLAEVGALPAIKIKKVETGRLKKESHAHDVV
jgi:hypothetical protein